MIQVHKQKCMVFVFMRDLPSFIMMCTGLKRETGIELHFKKPKSIFLVWKLAFAFKATGYFMHGIPLIYYSTFIDTLHSLGIIIFTYLSSKFSFQFLFRIAIQNIHSFFQWTHLVLSILLCPFPDGVHFCSFPVFCTLFL